MGPSAAWFYEGQLRPHRNETLNYRPTQENVRLPQTLAYPAAIAGVKRVHKMIKMNIFGLLLIILFTFRQANKCDSHLLTELMAQLPTLDHLSLLSSANTTYLFIQSNCFITI